MNIDSACSTLLPLDFLKNNPNARFSRLYFCHSLNRLQRGLSAIAELLVSFTKPISSLGIPIIINFQGLPFCSIYKSQVSTSV